MAEALSSLKGTVKKTKKGLSASRSFLHHASTPLDTVNTARLSLMPNARLQRITSNSLEKLSFISEKDENADFENYHIEYSTYLLRKVQNRLLSKKKEVNEENVKKCFVSLKYELEDLLEKYVKLSKDVGCFKIFLEILRQSFKKIEDGKKVLQLLKENEFEELMKSLSNSLDRTVNQLQLLDIDKQLIDDLFNRNIWGTGSGIDECLKKIEACISKNKKEVSNIAAELVEIKALSEENAALREKFHSVFQQVSNEILETNYKSFTEAVKTAFEHREDCKNEFIPLNLECDTDFLFSAIKPANPELSFQLSKLDGSYPYVLPHSSSTPQQNQL